MLFKHLIKASSLLTQAGSVHLNGTSRILKDQAREEQDVGVRKADLELDGLDEIEDGRPGDQKPVPVLGESSVGEMTDAGDLRNKKNLLVGATTLV